MRKVKWIFFAYLVLVAMMIAALGVSFALAPARDPDTLYAAYDTNIKTLDPGQIGDVTGSNVAGQIYECLYNYDYHARPYKIIPELATAMPAVSDNGLVYTIHIRPGVHYYDPDKKIWPDGIGPAVTAHDFIYAWKRVADFHLASQNYSAIFEGRVQGLDDFRKYTQSVPADKVDYARPVSGLQAPDDRTLIIRLTQPDPQLIYNLAHLPTAPVSPAAVNYWGDHFKDHPVGTGPYVLAEDLPDQRLVFTANPIYRGGSQVDSPEQLLPDKRLPHIKRVQLDYFDEALPSWALFQQGLLDIAGIPKDTFSQAINAQTQGLTPAMKAKGIVLNKSPDPDVWYFGFNMLDPIVGKNKPLRQAMSMAFDRKLYIHLFANDRGEPAIGPIPPGFETFDPKLVNPYTKFDLPAAKKKLAQAIRINGGPIPPIHFLIAGTDTGARQIGEFMKNQMQQIGLTIQPDYRTWARFQEMIDTKQAQFYTLGWEADYPDEQTFLQLFWSKNASPGPNSANYSNPAYDKLYEQAVVMPDSPQRRQLYTKMEKIVMEDTPWLLNFYSLDYMLHYDWVGNISLNYYAHGNRKYLTLNTKLRQQRLAHGLADHVSGTTPRNAGAPPLSGNLRHGSAAHATAGVD